MKMALNNLQRLICNKTKPNQTSIPPYIILCYIYIYIYIIYIYIYIYNVTLLTQMHLTPLSLYSSLSSITRARSSR